MQESVNDANGATALISREPATYGRQKVRSIAWRWLAGIAFGFAGTAALGLTLGLRNPVFVVAEIAFIAFLLVGHKLITARLDPRVRGNNGERHVGAILDGLASDGWRTLHDVSLGRGNVDHILVGPAGVITVETKSHRGRRKAANIKRAWLSQAYAQRKLIERITGQKVDCMLVFSHAYLVPAVSRQRGVVVLPARMVKGHLARRKPALAPEQVDEVHQRLADALAAGILVASKA